MSREEMEAAFADFAHALIVDGLERGDPATVALVEEAKREHAAEAQAQAS